MQQRLTELRAEYARGERQLAALDQQRQTLRDTLLRISGAIQVLEELQAAQGAEASQPQPSGNGVSQPAVAT
jgi:prefoldin subunit 5